MLADRYEYMKNVTDQKIRIRKSGFGFYWGSQALGRRQTLKYAYIALCVLVVVVGFFVPQIIRAPYYRFLVVNAAILAIFALGIGFLVKKLGMVSLGHALYFGGAAYAVAYLSTNQKYPLVLAIAVTLLLTVIVSMAIGSLIVKSRGIAFTMLTLAFGQMAHAWAGLTGSRSVTGGDDGVSIQFHGSLLGMRADQLADPPHMWILSWVVLVLIFIALSQINRSHFGRLLEAIRENEERVRFSGFGTYLPVLIAYMVSAVIAATGGILFALFHSFVSLDTLSWTYSGDGLIAVFVGGAWTATGPFVGAFLYMLGNAALISAGRSEWQLYVGIAVVVVMVFGRAGIVGTVKRWLSLGLLRMNSTEAKETKK